MSRIPKVVLGYVRSDSNPKTRYQIRAGRDNRIYCTCADWKWHPKGGKRTCKHLRRWRATLVTRLRRRLHTKVFY